MNKLFFVKCYHFKYNEWWRLLVTASDSDAAVKLAKEYGGDNAFTEVYAQYICQTPDELFLDV